MSPGCSVWLAREIAVGMRPASVSLTEGKKYAVALGSTLFTPPPPFTGWPISMASTAVPWSGLMSGVVPSGVTTSVWPGSMIRRPLL